MKNWFQIEFRISILSPNSHMSNETDDSSTILIETCKYCQIITDTKKKIIQDYYYNLANSKLTYKHI